jgi:hypothetical protein
MSRASFVALVVLTALPRAAGASSVIAEGEPALARPGVLYVNFDGVTTTLGGEAAPSNSSSVFGETFAPYDGDDTDRAAILAAVTADFAPYDVAVVAERPMDGSYTMVVVSPTNPVGGSFVGVAPIDCSDGQPNNIGFAFLSATDGRSAGLKATIISQQAGSTFGLEQVDRPGDIMDRQGAGDPSFLDECSPLRNAEAACPAVHASVCPEGGQNSHQELLAIFGPAVADVSAPTIAITSPSDGDAFAPGDPLPIELTVTDDGAIAVVELLLDGEAAMTDADAPYGWTLVDVPEGVF